jgi:hypothetical protein
MSKKRRPKSIVDLSARRARGLDGTYSGTCIACLLPTDTALGVRGEPEWHAAFLTLIGLPAAEAEAMVGRSEEPVDARGRYETLYRVCSKCAAKGSSSFPKPALALPGASVPTIGQPD